MNRELRVPDYLEHIHQAITRVLRYLNGVNWEAFQADSMTQDAIVRNLEIIGEASRNILKADPQFRDKHPGFPISEAVGMRNRIIHAYFDVNLATVWTTAQNDLPVMESKVEDLLAVLRREERLGET